MRREGGGSSVGYGCPLCPRSFRSPQLKKEHLDREHASQIGDFAGGGS